MATRKREVEINKISEAFVVVWCDVNPAQLLGIEGISGVTSYSQPGKYNVEIDPRYDADEVCAEIRALGAPTP